MTNLLSKEHFQLKLAAIAQACGKPVVSEDLVRLHMRREELPDNAGLTSAIVAVVQASGARIAIALDMLPFLSAVGGAWKIYKAVVESEKRHKEREAYLEQTNKHC